MEWIDDEDDLESSTGSDASGAEYQCPYCWQWVVPPIEADLVGDLVWDCEVCCRPWLIRIAVDYDGYQQVHVERSQD
jgi:hypothetical protein